MEKKMFDDGENKKVLSRSFRGYNTSETDAYIETLLTEIETLNSEVRDLSDKLYAAGEEIEAYKRERKVSGDILAHAKSEHDRIIKDAKSKADHIIMSTGNRCNDIVADMLSRVEEQKNIYEAAKKEVIRFRSALFSEYRDHIKKINAFAEAAGAFGANALSDEEMSGLSEMLGEDGQTVADSGDLDVSEEVREKVEKIKNNADKVAEMTLGMRALELSPDDTDDVSFEEDKAFEGDPFDESADTHEDADEALYAKAIMDLKSVVDADDGDEYVDNTVLEGAVSEYDGTVSVSDVYGDANDGEKDLFEEDVYSYTVGENVAESRDFPDHDSLDYDLPDEETLGGDEGYGFNIPVYPDDDEDEFYHEDDAEFISSGTAGGTPTLASENLFEVPSDMEETHAPKRFRVKKSMSITDEFDRIKVEEDD